MKFVSIQVLIKENMLRTALFCLLLSPLSLLAEYRENSSIYGTRPEIPTIATSEPAIEQIFLLKEIYPLLSQCGTGTLIVFDIDEVLITSKDTIFHPAAEAFLFELIKQEKAAAVTDRENRILDEKLALSIVGTERVLLDKDLPQFLRQLKEKGVKALALTSFPTGPFGKIGKLENFRADQLKSFGIDFSSFFGLERQEFISAAKEGIPPPLYDEGILYSRGYVKGDILLAFLDSLGWKPDKVIFIDDMAANLEGVKQALASRGIPFQGYHLQTAHTQFSESKKKAMEFQFRYLIEQNVWLSEEAAMQMAGSPCRP